jgi:hypothetical protein
MHLPTAIRRTCHLDSSLHLPDELPTSCPTIRLKRRPASREDVPEAVADAERLDAAATQRAAQPIARSAAIAADAAAPRKRARKR